MSLKDQLAEYQAGWYQRVPVERHAIMQRHILGHERPSASQQEQAYSNP
jgi:hypothetical protein